MPAEEHIDKGEDPDSSGELLPTFEKKYKDQMRQIITQRLDLPVSTLLMMLKDQIKVDPEFQRRDRWDESRQSRLIESLLMNVPIPPVFLGEDEYGQYVVLDGRQRLTAVRNFLNNTLRLRNLSVWEDLNGLIYEDFVKRGLDKHLTRRFIPAVVILKESSPAVKYDVFDRLNTGGVRAEDMEIRNAVFRGPFTDALHILSRDQNFCDLWDIPKDKLDAESNSLYRVMDDLAIVLRFFALFQPEKVEGPFRDYLSDFMQKRNGAYKTEPFLKEDDERKFRRAARNAWVVFGNKAFRKPSNGVRSLPLADAVLIAMAGIPPETVDLKGAEPYRTALDLLFQDGAFTKAISSGTNGKGAITTRINLARAAFGAV